MENNNPFQITSKQLIFVIIGSTIGMGVLSLPRVVTADLGQDGWIAVIIGSLVPLLSLFLIERLGRLFPNLTIVEIAQTLFGKILGFILIAGFIIYVIIFESVVLRLASEFTGLFALPKTPISIISLLIIIAVIYISQKGAKVVDRLNELLFYIVLFDLLLFIPVLGLVDLTNILPVGQKGLMAIAKGVIPTAYSFQGIDVLFMIYYMVTKKDEVLKAGITAIGIATIIYLIVVVIAILVFGVDLLQHITWPGIVLLKVVDIPVVERLEFFFLTLWMSLASRPVFTMSFAASFTLTNLLKLDMEKYYSIVVIIVGAAIYILSLIPSNIVQVFKFSNYVGYSFFIAGIGYPLLFYLAALLQKGRVKQNG